MHQKRIGSPFAEIRPECLGVIHLHQGAFDHDLRFFEALLRQTQWRRFPDADMPLALQLGQHLGLGIRASIS